MVADLVRRTDRTRFELHVIAVNFLGRYAEGLEEFAGLHVAGPLPRWSLLWPGPLIATLRRLAPDVVHIHSGAWYKGAFAARRAGVPLVVYTDHGRKHPDPLSDRVQDGLAARWTDVIVAVSDELARQLTAIAGSSVAEIVTIRNGIDTEAFTPREDDGAIRRELGIPASTPIIGSLGRLDHIKGYDVMIEAFAQLAGDGSAGERPMLLMAGDGPDREELERLIDARGIRERTRILGWRRDVHDLHAAFTVFTLSSRSEGTSISLLEAMSAGLCPVVTDVGGNAAVLGDALRHRLVESERPDLLARAWREALIDADARARDARAARQRVCERFSLSTMVRQYERIYSAVRRRRCS